MNLMYICAAALTPYEQAKITRIVFAIAMLVVAIALIVVVVMQKPVTNNIGSIAGEETQTYAGKNKAKSLDSILRKLTIAFGVILAAFSIAFFITYLF